MLSYIEKKYIVNKLKSNYLNFKKLNKKYLKDSDFILELLTLQIKNEKK